MILWYLDNSRNSELQNELSNYISIDETTDIDDDSTTSATSNTSSTATTSTLSIISVDFDKLKEINSSTVGFIYINNTNINYPIVQSSDNSYYLKHNFKNEYNSAGWIFADYINNFDTLDQNTIIYGHNRLNGTMFSNLTYLLDTSWYDDETNNYFYFVTENTQYIAQIFSVYQVYSDNIELKNNFSSTEEFNSTINSWKSSSIYNFDVEINSDDNLITLYTCGNNTDYRIIVHARLVSIDD